MTERPGVEADELDELDELLRRLDSEHGGPTMRWAAAVIRALRAATPAPPEPGLREALKAVVTEADLRPLSSPREAVVIEVARRALALTTGEPPMTPTEEPE